MSFLNTSPCVFLLHEDFIYKMSWFNQCKFQHPIQPIVTLMLWLKGTFILFCLATHTFCIQKFGCILHGLFHNTMLFRTLICCFVYLFSFFSVTSFHVKISYLSDQITNKMGLSRTTLELALRISFKQPLKLKLIN